MKHSDLTGFLLYDSNKIGEIEIGGSCRIRVSKNTEGMIVKKESVHSYAFSDAQLVQLTDNVISHARRNLVELSAFGYDAPHLVQVEALRDDVEPMAALTAATHEKTVEQQQEGAGEKRNPTKLFSRRRVKMTLRLIALL